tara:strand:- start:308 stop:964 length:657 start_codon:yes stop_codon:yes gene_type:complete
MAANEICATQTTTATSQALTLNGSSSDIAIKEHAGYVGMAVLPGVQRPMMINSTGNISTSTFTFVGVDIRGVALTTFISGPTGTAVPVKTVAEFHEVTSITAGALATSNFTVGFGPSGSTNWVLGDTYKNPFEMTISVVTTTGTPITVQETAVDANVTDPPAAQIFNHSTLDTVTVSALGYSDDPLNYTRAICLATLNTASSAKAAGEPIITFIQAGG